MGSKALTVSIVAFWAVMMTALVRVEFFPAPTRLRAVPVAQVMRRLFANSDTQHLRVWQQDRLIGKCQLTVSPRARLYALEAPPEASPPAAYFLTSKMLLRLQVLGVPSQFRL